MIQSGHDLPIVDLSGQNNPDETEIFICQPGCAAKGGNM